MKIDKAIKILEEAKQRHGNIPMVIYDSRGYEIKVKGTYDMMVSRSGSKRIFRKLIFTP